MAEFFPALTLRPAGIEDVPLLRRLADSIWRACYGDLLTLAQIDYMLPRMYDAPVLERELRSGIHYSLAFDQLRPVGYYALELPPASSSSPPVAVLHKIYLLPELHGRGAGQSLLRHALGLAASHGAASVQLRVNKANLRAQRAYRRAGFHIAGSLCEDIGGGFHMDDYIMTRALADFAPANSHLQP